MKNKKENHINKQKGKTEGEKTKEIKRADLEKLLSASDISERYKKSSKNNKEPLILPRLKKANTIQNETNIIRESAPGSAQREESLESLAPTLPVKIIEQGANLQMEQKEEQVKRYAKSKESSSRVNQEIYDSHFSQNKDDVRVYHSRRSTYMRTSDPLEESRRYDALRGRLSSLAQPEIQPLPQNSQNETRSPFQTRVEVDSETPSKEYYDALRPQENKPKRRYPWES